MPGNRLPAPDPTTRLSGALGSGGGVEADGGRGGEVEALGAAVDRDPDDARRRDRETAAGRPRASLPNSQAVGAASAPASVEVVQVGVAVTVGGEHLETAVSPDRDGLVRPASRRRPAGGTGCRRWPGRPSGCTGRRLPGDSTTASAPAASAQRITVPALPGSRTCTPDREQAGLRRGPRQAARRPIGRRRRRPAGSPCPRASSTAAGVDVGPATSAARAIDRSSGCRSTTPALGEQPRRRHRAAAGPRGRPAGPRPGTCPVCARTERASRR